MSQPVTVLRRVTEGDALATVSAPCCRTEFTARSAERAESMHVEYHNSQWRRGRREFRITVTAPATYNVIIFHANSTLPTLAASMITWDEAQELQSALITLSTAGAIDALGVSVVRVRE